MAIRTQIIGTFAGAVAAVGSLRAQSTPVDGERASLVVPAHAAYLAPDADGARVARDREVTPFGRAGSTISWYGHFADAGPVVGTITLAAPAGDTVRLRLSATAQRPGASGGTHADAVIVGTGTATPVPFGALRVEGPGYMRLALGLSVRGTAPKVRVTSLRLEGTPVDRAQFNLDARRNAASVHLRYPVDSTWSITGFYTEVTAVADPVDTYYMATGFARGYFGMQVNSPTERRIIFSVWDAGDGTNAKDRSTVAADDQVQLLGKGDGVVAEVFGNEGTGGHSHLVYDWKTGSTQRFFVTAAIDGTHTTYSGYWFHPARQRWQLIASFRAPKDGQGLRRLYSFSENFGGSTGDVARKARYGAQWVRLATGEWKELTTATFSHDATGKENRLDRWMGVEDGRFFLQHGGFVDGFTAAATAFSRPSSGAPPRIDLP